MEIDASLAPKIRDLFFQPGTNGAIYIPSRYKIAYGGRGSAKSWGFAGAALVIGAARPMRIMCAREILDSIRESVHQLLSEQVKRLGLDGVYEVQDKRIFHRSNGTEFIFKGIREHGIVNVKSFEGADIAWVEEAQPITKKTWDVFEPTIRKPGSEIWITFNPELDSDETYQRFVVDPPEDARVAMVNWRDNPWFSDDLDKLRRKTEQRDPVGYQTIWEGKCRPAVEGAIYAAEIGAMQTDGRLCNAPYDPLLKVHTIWDLGWNDSMSIILAQRSGSGEIRVIDYIEDSHRTLDSYVADLQQRKYQWGTDFIPHDGRSKDFKSGKSTEEMLQAMGRTVTVLGRDDVEEGIRLARMMFPRCWVDKKATTLINRLKRYRRTQNQTTMEFGAPLHDENSHGADCWRYLAMAEPQMSNDDWGGSLKYPNMGPR